MGQTKDKIDRNKKKKKKKNSLFRYSEVQTDS